MLNVHYSLVSLLGTQSFIKRIITRQIFYTNFTKAFKAILNSASHAAYHTDRDKWIEIYGKNNRKVESDRIRDMKRVRTFSH